MKKINKRKSALYQNGNKKRSYEPDVVFQMARKEFGSGIKSLGLGLTRKKYGYL